MKASQVVVLAGILLAVGFLTIKVDVLKDFSENTKLGHIGLQAAMFGFCLNSQILEDLANKQDTEAFDSHQKDMSDTNFEEQGNINEDDYTKQSIYSLLYSLYGDVGGLRFRGELYQFRFNTWGVGGVFDENGNRNGKPEMCAGPYTENQLTSYPATVVQRHGKTAYSSLFNFPTVKEKMAGITDRLVNVVEIGSGTGAGANELSWLHTNLNYTAVDMQARGTATCHELHSSAEQRFVAKKTGKVGDVEFTSDSRLNCLHANGQKLKEYLPDGFADIVLISETHIADVIPLDQETKNVLDQVKRLLKPGGLFVWGNAIPTSIWKESFKYLEEIGMEKREIYDVTDNAVWARDEDFSRVEHYYKTMSDNYVAMQLFPQCNHAVNRLYMNFCRHPGTALYVRMLEDSNTTAGAKEQDWCEPLGVPSSLCTDARIDSYVHLCYQKPL